MSPSLPGVVVVLVAAVAVLCLLFGCASERSEEVATASTNSSDTDGRTRIRLSEAKVTSVAQSQRVSLLEKLLLAQ